jgi:ketosteroid isomerase-like protein
MKTPDPQLHQQLEAKTKSYGDAANRNDATAVAGHFTEDGVLVTDKGPVYGRQAIGKWYADAFQELHNKNFVAKLDQYSPHIIGTVGNEVWMNGEWSETIQPEGSDVIHLTGYWSAVAVRDGDTWKDRMLTWNITPPAAP